MTALLSVDHTDSDFWNYESLLGIWQDFLDGGIGNT